MPITLKQLRSFVALVEARNFGRAAAAVHITQPALSVQIKDLETQLGGALVERRARDVVLTPFGREALAHAHRILAETKALEQAARWRGGLAGRLRLGLIPTVAPYLLPEALSRLRARDLSLEIQVVEATTDDLLAQLQSGEIDTAVLALPSQASGVEEVALYEERFLLAGSARGIAQLQGDELRPDQIAAEQLLLLDEGHCLADQALSACGHRADQRRVDMAASSLTTLAGLAAAGFGVTLMPESAAPVEAASAAELRLRRFTSPEPGRVIGLLRRQTTSDDGWFSELADVLSEAGRALLDRATKDPAARQAGA